MTTLPLLHDLVYALLGLLIAGVPWLVTPFILAAFGGRRGPVLVFGPIEMAVVGYFGIISLAFALWVADCLGIDGDLQVAAAGWVCLLLCIHGLFFFKSKSAADRTSFGDSEYAPRFLVVYMVTLVFVSLYLTLITPTFAWDGLDFWFKTSWRLIEHRSDVTPTSFEYGGHRHPYTTSLISSFSAEASRSLVGASHVGPIWISLALIIFFGLYGLARERGWSRSGGMLLSILFLSIPLIENHYLIYGYTELFVLASLLLSLIYCVRWFTQRQPRTIVIFTLLSVSTVFLRNTGSYYASIPVLAITLVYCWPSNYNYNGLMLLIGSCVLFSLIGLGQLLDSNFFHEVIPDQSVILAGKTLTFKHREIMDIFNNEFVSLFKNASFSTLFIAVGFLVLSAVFLPLKNRVLPFLSVGLFLSLGGLVLAQYSEHGYLHAIPSNDTGNSRFTLPVLAWVICIVVEIPMILAGDNKLP